MGVAIFTFMVTIVFEKYSKFNQNLGSVGKLFLGKSLLFLHKSSKQLPTATDSTT